MFTNIISYVSDPPNRNNSLVATAKSTRIGHLVRFIILSVVLILCLGGGPFLHSRTILRINWREIDLENVRYG
jgi:hypothetical protein